MIELGSDTELIIAITAGVGTELLKLVKGHFFNRKYFRITRCSQHSDKVVRKRIPETSVYYGLLHVFVPL